MHFAIILAFSEAVELILRDAEASCRMEQSSLITFDSIKGSKTQNQLGGSYIEQLHLLVMRNSCLNLALIYLLTHVEGINYCIIC